MLHILTPTSEQSPSDLLTTIILSPDDIVADFRSFPPNLYQTGEYQTLNEITEQLLPSTNYFSHSRDWLIQLTKKTGLQEIYALDGFGLWWTRVSRKFIPAFSYAEYGNMFAWIDILISIREYNHPNKIYIYGIHDIIDNLARQVFADEPIQVENQGTNTNRSRKPRKWGLQITRLFLGIFGLVYILIRKPSIGFFSSASLLRQRSNGETQELKDIFLGDVAESLQAHGWSTVFIEQGGRTATWKGLTARGAFFPIDIIFLLTHPKIIKRLGINGLYKKWHKIFQKVKAQVQAHLRYADTDLAPILLPLIRTELIENAPSLELATCIWRGILRFWHPKLLYINCSYGSSAMPAILAAKHLQIPTIEQQHGAVSKNNLVYFIPKELSTTVVPPLCDKMIVWGERMLRLLTQSGVYHTNQVLVCGSVRLDRLLLELPPRDFAINLLNIPITKSIVLYTSNMLAEGFIQDILDSIQTNPDPQIHWIIKLHPREETRSTWEAGIGKRCLQNVSVVKNELDFYALLTACDIHVSLASTTILEATILGKLNLGLDIKNMPDPAGYKEVKAFLPIKPSLLAAAIREILYSPDRMGELLNEQKSFATDWCIHDGQALNRTVYVIESTLHNSNE